MEINPSQASSVKLVFVQQVQYFAVIGYLKHRQIEQPDRAADPHRSGRNTFDNVATSGYNILHENCWCA